MTNEEIAIVEAHHAADLLQRRYTTHKDVPALCRELREARAWQESHREWEKTLVANRSCAEAALAASQAEAKLALERVELLEEEATDLRDESSHVRTALAASQAECDAAIARAEA